FIAWLDRLPLDLVRAHSRLCRKRSWALIYLGRLDEVETWLHAAERGPWKLAPAAVRAEIAAIRAGAARHAGDERRAIALTAEALPALAEDDPVLRGVVLVTLAVAYGISGDVTASERTLDDVDRIADE